MVRRPNSWQKLHLASVAFCCQVDHPSSTINELSWIMARFAFGICLILVLFYGVQASARDIFVDNVAGDDRMRGYSPEPGQGTSGPIKTLAKAMRICGKADRIVLANHGVPYHESLSFSAGKHWGFASQPFTIVGNGATLDGSLPVPPNEWDFEGRDVFRFLPPTLSHQQLYLAGKPAVRKLFALPDSTPLTLEPLEWMLHEGSLFFRPEKSMLPSDYELSYMGLQTGITLYHVQHVRIENLIVQGFRLDGINFHDGCNDCVLIDVTARGNGRSGISIGGSSRAVIENCVIGDNGEAQIRTEGYCLAEVIDSEIVDNTAPAFEVTGGQLYRDAKRIEKNAQP